MAIQIIYTAWLPESVRHLDSEEKFANVALQQCVQAKSSLIQSRSFQKSVWMTFQASIFCQSNIVWILEEKLIKFRSWEIFYDFLKFSFNVRQMRVVCNPGLVKSFEWGNE